MIFRVGVLGVLLLPLWAVAGDYGNENPGIRVGINANVNKNKAVAGAVAGSASRSDSNSTSSSSSGGNILSVEGGELSSSNSATSGNSTSSGGDATSYINVGGDEFSAASAAPVSASYCNRGGSGQAEGGGAAIAFSDPLCDLYRVADRELLAYQQQVIWCAEKSPACDEQKKLEHLGAYNQNLHDAENLVQGTKYLGWVSRIADNLVIPGALIWVLFLL